MNDVLLLYLFTRLDAINVLALVLAMGGGVAAVAAAMTAWAKEDTAEIWAREPENPRYKNRMASAAALRAKIRPLAIFAFAFAVVTVAIPSKTDVAVIVGGKIALDVGRSETAQEVGQEVVDAIRAQLKKAAE